MKKQLTTILRLVIAIALLIFLLHSIGIDQLNTVLSSLNPTYFAVLYTLLTLDAVLRAYNWRTLLQTKGHHIPLPEVLYNYMVGAFFGTFIPSSLGTDISRAFLMARRNQVNAQDSALAMVVLNLTGLLALCTFAFLSIFKLRQTLAEPTLIWIIALVCLSFMALFPFLMWGWVPNLERWNLPKFTQVFIKKIQEFSLALGTFKHHRKAMVSVLVIAFLNQLVAILVVYTVSLALNLDVPFSVFVSFVPVIVLSRLIPLSIAGLGAEQGIAVFLFAQAGVPSAEAFLISIILSITGISFALIGGAIYSLDKVYALVYQPES